MKNRDVIGAFRSVYCHSWTVLYTTLARRFLKAVFRVECFENASLPLLYGQMKTEVFEYDDVIHRSTQGMLSYFHRSSVFARISGRKQLECTTGGRIKKTPFLKLSGYVWMRPILIRFDSHNFAFWKGKTAFSCNHGGWYRVKWWKKVLKKPKVFDEEK